MDKGLVALNIQNTLLEGVSLISQSCPIMFYWDGTLTLKDDLHDNEQFNAWLNKNVFNTPEYYFNGVICYTIYNYETKEFISNKEYIKDIFPLSEVELVRNTIIYNSISALHNTCMGTHIGTYINKLSMQTALNAIIDKYMEKVSEETIIFYLYNYIKNKYKLSYKELDIIKNEIKNILE